MARKCQCFTDFAAKNLEKQYATKFSKKKVNGVLKIQIKKCPM